MNPKAVIALGLLKRRRSFTYAVASLIGILPFAFVWSYAGGELRAWKGANPRRR